MCLKSEVGERMAGRDHAMCRIPESTSLPGPAVPAGCGPLTRAPHVAASQHGGGLRVVDFSRGSHGLQAQRSNEQGRSRMAFYTDPQESHSITPITLSWLPGRI